MSATLPLVPVADLDGSPAPGDLDGWTDDERARFAALNSGVAVVVNMRAGAHLRLWRWAERAGLAVRIDRRSPWANPFVVGRDGDRAAVIDRYRRRLHDTPELLDVVAELEGRVLGCWCAPQPCHGDVLAGVLTARVARQWSHSCAGGVCRVPGCDGDGPRIDPVAEGWADLAPRPRGLPVSEMSDRIGGVE